MTIKLNKSDASWLKKAVAVPSSRVGETLHFVSVCDSRYGHVAVACDSYRLHVLEVPDNIPNDLYIPNGSTGELEPVGVIMDRTYPDWEVIVASDNAYCNPCDSLDKWTILDTGEYLYRKCYAFDRLVLQSKFVDQAIGKYKSYQITAQDKPTKPVRVSIVGKRTQFAILHPMQPLR